ncbi:hypothetical protein KIN20_026209 [Parelaphostrongylus tenuis]|uniref:Uncharacterized protein n=1 Tax=Parelaphostrongylus tenuis TaxID=148309 RepID=A0AAD5MWG1_PARTN|nr:hypothetical protein KIN20_026209 [Parelaphostrongylus tenuis]
MALYFSTIMDQTSMCTMSSWLRSKQKMFQNRVIVSMLIMVNFGNSIIISMEALDPNLMLSIVASVINTIIVIMALYGIFAFKPIFVAPNVIAKISLSSAALFHGMQEAESNDSTSVFHFLWLLTSACLFIWEIHAMFSTTFGIMKEMKLRAYNKPPPSYNQVIADDIPPPTYEQATERSNKPLILDATQLEAVVGLPSMPMQFNAIVNCNAMPLHRKDLTNS